jgi:PIN domain nuclease of toxin-antitoxin system
MPSLLLDTCAMIFIATGREMTPGARQEVRAASVAGGILVSPISAWEVGLLSGKRGVPFHPDPKSWFQRFMTFPGARLTPLTPDIAVESSFLPPPLHGDPADRLLIATARALGVPIVTRDHRILAYAQSGLVAAIAC